MGAYCDLFKKIEAKKKRSMTKAKKESVDSKEMRDLRSELKEEHEMRMQLREQVAELEAKNARLHENRQAVYFGLIVERNDLMTRIMRIDMRITALGFKAPPPVQ